MVCNFSKQIQLVCERFIV